MQLLHILFGFWSPYVSLPLQAFVLSLSFFFLPLLSFFLFSTESVSESLMPISLQLNPLHSLFTFSFSLAASLMYLCARTCLSLSLSLMSRVSLSLSHVSLPLSLSPLSISLSSFDSAFAPQHSTHPQPPPTPTIAWEGPDIQHYNWKDDFSKNVHLSAEMLNRLNLFKSLSQKKPSFWGNVEYVEYVECFWNLQTPLWTPQLPEEDPTINIRAERSIFPKCASFWGMLNVLNMFESLSPKMCFFQGLDGPITNRQSWANAVNSRKPFCRSMWNEGYTNEHQSRDSNRNATNAKSTRTKFCVFRGRYDRQWTLVIRIAAITLASDSSMTLVILPI